MSATDVDPVYEEFKPIRNKLRKFNRFQFFQVCFKRLAMADESIRGRRSGRKPMDYFVSNPPWEILLLMKWILRYGERSDRVGKQVSYNDIEELREQLGDCHDAKIPASPDDSYLYLRRYNSQIPYTYPIDKSHVARQSLLFRGLDKDDALRTMFQKKAGIEISDHIELEMILLSQVYGDNDARLFKLEDFSKLDYAAVVVQQFLTNISATLDEMQDSILSTSKKFKPVIAYELHEDSPFIQFPLLRTPEGFFCYSHLLLLLNFKNSIYDIFRSTGAEEFMRLFSKKFEEYVETAVQHSQLEYLTESSLRDQLGEEKGSGFVDFILYDSGAMILIDAKGVEMHYMGQVSENPLHLTTSIETSVLKGIKQAYSLLGRLDGMKECPIRISAENFLLIVTFKDFFLENGLDIYAHCAKDKVMVHRDALTSDG